MLEFEPPAFNDLRVNADTGLTNITPHDLRHTAASLTVASSAPVGACSGCSGTRRQP
jgi:integrase